MSLSRKVRNALVESPTSLGEKARAKRWELTRRLFPDFDQMRVVDLGGTCDAWLRAPYRPAEVVVVNLFEPGESGADWLIPVTGDACAAREVLESQLGRSDFDLVFSNAVLEHVGGHANRLRFADSVRELAPRHWVQTPYRYFPIEPHWLFPWMQHLPVAAKARVATTWKLAHTPATALDQARESVLWTELISLTEMRVYFPESQILHERMAGLTKSLIAIRSRT